MSQKYLIGRECSSPDLARTRASIDARGLFTHSCVCPSVWGMFACSGVQQSIVNPVFRQRIGMPRASIFGCKMCPEALICTTTVPESPKHNSHHIRSLRAQARTLSTAENCFTHFNMMRMAINTNCINFDICSFVRKIGNFRLLQSEWLLTFAEYTVLTSCEAAELVRVAQIEEKARNREIMSKPDSAWISNFGRKLRFGERFAALRAPNDLKTCFPVHMNMANSFVKLVCSYQSFRSLQKTSCARKSQNQVFPFNSRLRGAMVFLIADSDSTQKVTSIAMFLLSKRLFGESYKPKPVFGQNPVFARCDPWTHFQRYLTPDSETSWSKVPGPKWDPIFFLIRCETHPSTTSQGWSAEDGLTPNSFRLAETHQGRFWGVVHQVEEDHHGLHDCVSQRFHIQRAVWQWDWALSIGWTSIRR